MDHEASVVLTTFLSHLKISVQFALDNYQTSYIGKINVITYLAKAFIRLLVSSNSSYFRILFLSCNRNLHKNLLFFLLCLCLCHSICPSLTFPPSILHTLCGECNLEHTPASYFCKHTHHNISVMFTYSSLSNT